MGCGFNALIKDACLTVLTNGCSLLWKSLSNALMRGACLLAWSFLALGL